MKKDEIYTVAEFAEKVGRTRANIYQLIQLGKLKAKRDVYTDKIKILMSDWEDYLKPHLVDYVPRKHTK